MDQKSNLILLHGALGSSEQFNSLKKELKAHFQVFTLDFPGHGHRKDTPFDIPFFTTDVINFLDKNQIQKTNIFGYSMGGYVALYLASTFPDRVDKIMTLGTKINWSPAFAESQKKLMNPEKILEKVPAFAGHLAEVHGSDRWADVLIKTSKMMQRLGQSPPISDDVLSGIENRVTICRGSNDNMVEYNESKHAADTLPNGQYIELKDMPHPIEKVQIPELQNLILKCFQ